jgi:hypothetical protein
MHNARLRVMAGLAGATLCLFAVTSYAQNTDPATGAPQTSTQAPTTGAQPTTPTGDATTPPATDQGTTNGTITTTGSQTTTETTTTSFPGGVWGIVAVAVVILLVLFGLFRGKGDRTVVKDTYVSNPPASRSTGMGTADDRVVTSRAASGTETTTTTTRTDDPNARR